jgi:hypothetical protein
MFGLDDVDTGKFLKVGWTQAWEQSLLYFPPPHVVLFMDKILLWMRITGSITDMSYQIILMKTNFPYHHLDVVL